MVRAVSCSEVAREEVMRLERLYQDKQYERAVAWGFSIYRKLVGDKTAESSVQDFGFLLAASLEAHKRAAQGLAHAEYRTSLTAQQIRRQVEGYYEEAQKLGVKQPLRLSGLTAKLGIHRRPDLSDFPEGPQKFLAVFLRCVWLDGDSRLAQLCQDAAAQLTDARAQLALADYLLAYTLLTRDDDQVVDDVQLLPAGLTTSAQLAEYADFAYRLKRLNAAVHLWDVAARKAADGNTAVGYLLKRAEILLALRGAGEGIEAYRRVVEEYRHLPGAADAQLQVIKLLAFQWNRYGDAARECRLLMDLFPGTPQAVQAEFMVAQLYYLARDYDRAKVALEGVIRKYAGQPWVVNARLLLGFTYLEEDNTAEARALFREIARLDVDEEAAAQAQLYLGYVALIERNYARALREFRELAQRSPQSTYARQTERYIEVLSCVVGEPE
jgi:TolA-binding protein